MTWTIPSIARTSDIHLCLFVSFLRMLSRVLMPLSDPWAMLYVWQASALPSSTSRRCARTPCAGCSMLQLVHNG